jgi:hypothetical protein
MILEMCHFALPICSNDVCKQELSVIQVTEKANHQTIIYETEILPPLQNISKSESKKLDVFGSKFRPNTFTFVDQLLLIFCNGGSILVVILFQDVMDMLLLIIVGLQLNF